MTDYSKMSDFEINKAVVIGLGAKQIDYYENGDRCAIYYELGDEGLTVRRGQSLLNDQFNPCNNPADAWSIIVENKISIDHLDKEIWGAKAFVPNGEPMPRYAEKNPLRAAMIVFLMMKEAGNVQTMPRTRT